MQNNMLLINLNTILYHLTNLRSYILLSKEVNNDHFVLVANNTLIFYLTPKEFNLYTKFTKIKSYTNVLLTYNQIKSKDETSEKTYKSYPILRSLNVTYADLFSNCLKILETQKLLELTGIILKRTKKNFYVSILGIKSSINRFKLFNSMSALWSKYFLNSINILSYKKFIKIFIASIANLLLIKIKSLSLKLIFLSQKQKIYRKKIKKKAWKKKSKPKITFLISSDQLL